MKAPVVYIAGLLRLRGRAIDTNSWSWISDMAGMRLFRPPNVAGWDETRWMDTSSFRGRWWVVTRLMEEEHVNPDDYSDGQETTSEAIERALRFWGQPSLSSETRVALEDFCDQVADAATENWQRPYYRGLRQNALRMLIATAPEMQVS